ncbi:MAG: YajQ family cyclic di-GMP-binding protein [bacterium]|nr:YajQ family cyclic di-GMP-binding protein [bacterium]
MAGTESFDVTTGCDMQEVDNAINQTRKEIAQRYDFRGLKIDLDFKRADNQIVIGAPEEYNVKAVVEVLQSKMVRRNVPVKNLKNRPIEGAGSGTVRQVIDLQQGIPTDTAKSIVKFLKEKKLKKVQASIQGDQVRIQSPSRDVLQEVIQILKEEDFGMELEFGNYR